MVCLAAARTISQLGEEAHSFLLYDHGVTLFNDTVVVTEETLASKRKELVAWLRASRKGWAENLADPALYPPQWENTWFAGTGRSIENEVFFNTAQKPLIEAPNGIFSMGQSGQFADVPRSSARANRSGLPSLPRGT